MVESERKQPCKGFADTFIARVATVHIKHSSTLPVTGSGGTFTGGVAFRRVHDAFAIGLRQGIFLATPQRRHGNCNEQRHEKRYGFHGFFLISFLSSSYIAFCIVRDSIPRMQNAATSPFGNSIRVLHIRATAPSLRPSRALKPTHFESGRRSQEHWTHSGEPYFQPVRLPNQLLALNT